jgi:hypothetical protein
MFTFVDIPSNGASGPKFVYVYLAVPLNAEWLLYLWLCYQILSKKLEFAVLSLLLKVFEGHWD